MSKKEKKKETTGEMIRSLVYALLIALVFRSLAYEPFHIPSGSMQNTLQVGDYIFVSKLSYGYSRYSFPLGIDWFEGRKFFTEPQRGDIIVFRPPLEPKTDYIKRLVGLPGDRIQMRQGILHINDTPLNLTRLADKVTVEKGQLIVNSSPVVLLKSDTLHVKKGILYMNDVPVLHDPAQTHLSMKDGSLTVNGIPAKWRILTPDNLLYASELSNLEISRSSGQLPFAQRFEEVLPEGIRHDVLSIHPSGIVDNTREYIVPEGHYFMMGDNRDQSQDSRFLDKVGFVPVENLVGRAEVIAVSFKGGVPLWKFWQWPNALRHDRWFTSLDDK